MARYHTILFDADNTLLDFVRSEREALTDALRALHVEPCEEMLQTYSRINDAVWKKLERGEIDKITLRTARFVEFCEHYALAVDPIVLAEHYLSALATKSFLMAGALEVCEHLAADCRLYIITNGIAAVQHGRLDHSPLRPFFEEIFISDEIGVEKPDPAYFARVMARIPDFNPKTTLVVGDSLTSDIAGGIAAGLDTCWLNAKGKEPPKDMKITYVITRLEDVIPLALGA